MVSSGQILYITNPEELAVAITAATGVANVIVMLGKFDYEENIIFKKIPKISDLSTISFRDNSIWVWKQGRYGQGYEIKMNHIPFPATFDYQFIGSEKPRRKEKPLLFKKSGDTEVIEGEIEDFDDENDQLKEPIIQGEIYICPEPNCDAEFQSLGGLFDHQIRKKCFQKTKLRTETIHRHFQKKYIDMFGLNMSEKLTKNESRYRHTDFSEEIVPVSLLPQLSEMVGVSENVFVQGFAVKIIRTKNPIHDDVRAFVKEIFLQGEITNRHMPYPDIVSAIEDAKDDSGYPKFFPEKWLDYQQVSYLVSKFIKEKATSSKDVEPTPEDIANDLAQEHFTRRRDAIRFALENIENIKPLREQSHPLLLEDGTNICEIARDYNESENPKDSILMQELQFDDILPILNAIDHQQEGKNRRVAAQAIVKFVKTQCGCIPLRRKKNT